MKIVSTGKTISSFEFYEKRVRAKRKKILILSGVSVFVLALIIFISRLENLRIATVNVSGAKVISPDAVISVSDEVLSGYYLWLIPRDNILLYPRQKLERAISTRHPRFSSVQISLSGLNTLDIVLAEREPYALYCGEVAKPDETSECYFLDNTGLVFDRAPSFSSGVYFVFAGDSISGEPLGQEFLPSQEFESLMNFLEELSQLGFHSLSLELSLGEFHLSFEKQGELIWRREPSLERTFSNLKSFLAEPSIASQTDFLQKVGELDLRTEDKVFYRFNDE